MAEVCPVRPDKTPIIFRPGLGCTGALWVRVSLVRSPVHSCTRSFLPPADPAPCELGWCSPDGPCAPALAGGMDLPVEVLLELQAGVRRVPLERVRQTDRQTGTSPCKAVALSPSRAVRW